MKSLYIHIPFCSNICSYCDFCKLIYKEDLVLEADDSFKKSIEHFLKSINDKNIREETYNNLLLQAKLVEEFMEG